MLILCCIALHTSNITYSLLFDIERVALYCSAQAGQDENVTVWVVWNSDIKLHNASNVRMEFPSPFVLSTTKILRYFIHQNVVRESYLLYWIICVLFSIFIS